MKKIKICGNCAHFNAQFRQCNDPHLQNHPGVRPGSDSPNGPFPTTFAARCPGYKAKKESEVSK